VSTTGFLKVAFASEDIGTARGFEGEWSVFSAYSSTNSTTPQPSTSFTTPQPSTSSPIPVARNGTNVSLTCGGKNCGSGCTPSSGSTSGKILMDYAEQPVECWWFMNTSTGSEISIEFPVFKTRTNDLVRIFRCRSAECEYEDMIAQLTGDASYNMVYQCNKNQCSTDELVATQNSLKTDEVFTSTTCFLRVTFSSDTETYSSFEATWKGSQCEDARLFQHIVRYFQ
jgi:hypothetical protein